MHICESGTLINLNATLVWWHPLIPLLFSSALLCSDLLSALFSAHTCFNHLLLPEYSSLEVLREKLHYAMNHTEGFGLR